MTCRPSLLGHSGLNSGPRAGTQPLRRPKDAQRARPFFVPSAQSSPSNMPKRTDISSILIIGAGPIVIGQACEFDYSGTQAVKALKAEGFEIVLVNSNPATIMTDPELADRTYVEPLTPEYVEAVIAREKPDALLPTVGGQTALNLALALVQSGALARHNVQLIGASADAIRSAESRDEFKRAMQRIHLDVPVSEQVSSAEAALAFAERIGYPVVLRPSFT